MKTGALHSDQDSQKTMAIDLEENSLMELEASQSEIQLGTYVSKDGQVSQTYFSAKDFHKFGMSIADWARAHHFNVRLVYSVVRGERKCLRGESYQIAKELGMK